MKLFSNKAARSGENLDTSLPGYTPVFFYDDPQDHKNLKGRHKNYDGTQTCEVICRNIAIENGFTPLMLHCFGLTLFDVSSKSYIWLSPSQKPDDIPLSLKCLKIHFRMRYIPHESKLDKLLELDTACFYYLVSQVTWDFLMDYLPCFVVSEKIEEARGVSCLLMMYKLREDAEIRRKRRDDLKGLLKNFNSFLPSSLQKSVFEGKQVLKTSMSDCLEELIEKFPLPCSSTVTTSIMQWFLRHILKQNSDYYVENFTGYFVDMDEEEFEAVDDEPPLENSEKLKITVEMCQDDPSLVVVKENNEEYFKNYLVNIVELIMTQREDRGKIWWMIRIFRQNGHPQVIFFDDKMVANSFLSCLECYCRCVYDFYTSLCKDVQPKDMQEFERMRVHGPVTDDSIEKVLMKRNRHDLYILRTNPKLYDQYDVFYLSKRTNRVNSITLPKINQLENGYAVEGSSDAVGDLKDLLRRLVQSSNGLPNSIQTNGSCIKPTYEGCDLLWEILFEKFTSQKDEESEETKLERKRVENQPKVFLESDVQKMSLIGTGYFTETFNGTLMEKDVVIKQLRADKIPTHDFRTIYQEFQTGFQKLMLLYVPKYFVPYYGISLAVTPSMLIGGTGFGSLSHFLQNRQPSQMLSLHHLLEVSVQLMSALEHMEKMNCFHGNLKCENLAVMTFDERYLIVKITDPGLVSLYNKLPMNHEINQARLPWLAPELHSNLSAVNIQTEVYAYSTTLWQMFSNGHSPCHHDPKLIALTPGQVQSFFASGNDIMSCPDILRVLPNDLSQVIDLKEQLYKVMVSCWTLDPEERMEPKRILRELSSNMESYGDVYHKYNEISYITYDVGSSHSVMAEPRNSSGFHGTGHSNVPDISVLRVESHREPSGPILPQPASNVNERSRSHVPQETVNPALSRSRPRTADIIPAAAGAAAVGVGVGGGGSVRNLPPLPALPFYLIDDKRLEILEKLGEGHYGQVHMGILKPDVQNTPGGSPSQPEIVVVKELKADMRDKCDDAFKKEAMVMAGLEHPNIVKFYGMSRTGKYLVMEHVANNSLIKYLKAERNRKGVKFLPLAVDITLGMEYLENNNILHCDLAARNILLTIDLRAKISDFGLSKMLPSSIYYYRRHEDQIIPVPWCSPEVIEERGKFTTKSDVWSFGVVLWEMYSYGKAPYLSKNVPDMLKKLHDGDRLPQPDKCPDEVYDIMKLCWNIARDLRPSFQECKQKFQELLNKTNKSSVTTAMQNPSVTSNTSDGAQSVDQTTGPQSAVSSLERRNTAAHSAINGCHGDVNLQSVQTNQSASWTSGPSSINHNIMIDRKDLFFKTSELLGKGAFGKVYRGKYLERTVAIKECTRDDVYSRFEREFKLLHKLRNKSENIVHFIGLCEIRNAGTQRTKYRYVMEYLSEGSLHSYLIRQKKEGDVLTLQQRLKFLVDVAKGMECLFSNSIIHCDLTTKNILLGKDDSGLTAKIGDFGWAKHLENDAVNFEYKRNDQQVQLIWAAPESFREIYCKFSDIWSYGVLCIEVFKDGETPALQLPVRPGDLNHYSKFYQALLDGTRFPKPYACPQDVYDGVLLKCWNIEPRERIKFNEILTLWNRKIEELKTESQLTIGVNSTNDLV